MDDDPHHGIEQHVEGIQDAMVVEGEGFPVIHTGTPRLGACKRKGGGTIIHDSLG